MAVQGFVQLYAGAPEGQRAELVAFREQHACREIEANGKIWRTIAAGQGAGRGGCHGYLFFPGAYAEVSERFLTGNGGANRGQ